MIQVLLGWTVAAAFIGLLVVHRTALLGFTVWAAFNILSASHSGLLWSSLFGMDYTWVDSARIVVFQYVGVGMLLFA
ncbi:MAG: hypothetical protein IT577_14940, partial [Verrucomicrobiae bacterium]|nr:hypothetical protein [Verrucomicrobiae bacterium]